MGKKSRDKGCRVERLIVNKLQECGIHARRVPLSGACQGEFSGDIRIQWKQRTLLGEIKARKNGAGFKVLENWLGDNDLLFLKRDNQDPIITLRWETLIELLAL